MATGLKREAFKKLKSPDELDRAITLVSPRHWIVLGLMGALAAALLAWSVLGSISTQVTGLGLVLSEGGAVYDVSAPAVGNVRQVAVVPGDTVSAGDLIAVIDEPQLETELRAARSRAQTLQSQYDAARRQIDGVLEERKRSSDALVAQLERKIEALEGQANRLRSLLGEQVADLGEGYITRQEVDDTRRQLDSVTFDVASTREQIAQTQVENLQFAAEQQRTLDSLDVALTDARLKVEELESQVDDEERLVSPVDGRVVEVAAKAGDRVAVAQQIATVVTGEKGLTLHGFFRAADGKKIAPGMSARVAISSADPSVYGTAMAQVEAVSELPVTQDYLVDLLGSPALAQEMMADGAPIYVRLAFATDADTPSGLAWTSSEGPPFPIDPGTFANPAVTVASEPPINYVAPILPVREGLARAAPSKAPADHD